MALVLVGLFLILHGLASESCEEIADRLNTPGALEDCYYARADEHWPE